MGTTSGQPRFLTRLWGRIRYGLLTQEILDNLMRRGIVFYPYWITSERNVGRDLLPDPDYTIRELNTNDVPEISRITIREVSEQALIKDLARARCYGVLAGETLAGYTWVLTHHVPIPVSRGAVLFELRSDEAYLYDMFISPEYRGARLAPQLRSHVLQRMYEEGRSYCYSITLRFNRSSRRFKARFGAKESELRLYMHLRLTGLKGIDLRLWRRQPHLRTRFMQTIDATGKQTSDS